MIFLRKIRDLRTFSNRVESRYITLSDKMLLNESQKENLVNVVKRINKNLDLIIQDLLIRIPNRQIPFVKVIASEKVSNNKLRLLFADKNEDIDETLPKYINIDNLTHLIKFRITPGSRQIILSQEASKINAEMLIDEEYIVCAATDIFLDIAMFNSYSFLRDLDDDDKKAFSSLKYKFYKESGCNCYYHYKPFLEKEPLYFSFAFAARKSKTEIDLNTYIYLWNDFLEKHFNGSTDVIEPILDQIKYHKSYKQITKDDQSGIGLLNRFDSLGAKLLLRINKKPNHIEKREQIANYFRIPKFHLGSIKIVDLEKYHDPVLSEYLRYGYVSAFKVVVTEENIKVQTSK